ncbi:cat eye syndrome critical region protein 6-like protein [Elysia marginata]|uniref:Cat eye syndrome critical region protein 6-like protein n=1 Tax=Elysia marginata TaxID=1093978 RepID=A0AAV4FFP2_9GAST|nr:cat eye syndrome critical region protein 6-like protein [Elysia marginata]
MTLAGDCFVRSCLALHNTPAAVICVALSALQMAALDYYLVFMLSINHLGWLAADGVNLSLLMFCIVQARSALYKQNRDDSAKVQSLAWASWFLMSVSVSAKVCVLIAYCIKDLEEEVDTFWGANTLKTTVALGACIFLLLLITQHDAALGSEGRRYIEELTGTVVFDILDTVEILDTLFDLEKRKILWHTLEEVILVLAVVNLLLPTVPLFTLACTQFGRKKLQKRMIYLHRLLVVLIVNVPILAVRMVLWHGHSMGVSPFTLKNIVLILLTTYEFYEHKKMKFCVNEQGKYEAKCGLDIEETKNKISSQPSSVDHDRLSGTEVVPLSSGTVEGGDFKSDVKETCQYEGDFGIEARVVTFW